MKQHDGAHQREMEAIAGLSLENFPVWSGADLDAWEIGMKRWLVDAKDVLVVVHLFAWRAAIQSTYLPVIGASDDLWGGNGMNRQRTLLHMSFIKGLG
jgi:hypothetical protein